MKKIYIDGGKHYTPEIQRHIESIHLVPSNVEGSTVNTDFQKLIASDAIYLAQDWTQYQESVLAFKIARHYGLVCYKAKSLDLLEKMDIAILELFNVSAADIRKFNRKPLVTSVRTMYVGLAKSREVSNHVLTLHLQRQGSEIIHLQKKHKEFYKYDPKYRRMFDRMEDFLEFGFPKMAEYYEQNTKDIIGENGDSND